MESERMEREKERTDRQTDRQTERKKEKRVRGPMGEGRRVSGRIFPFFQDKKGQSIF